MYVCIYIYMHLCNASMHLCMLHLYIYVSIHLCRIYESLYPCTYVSMYLCICIQVCLSACMRMHVCICMCISVCVSMCICVDRYVSACICVSLHVSACICMYLYTSVCIWMYLNEIAHMHMYIYIYIYRYHIMRVSACVFICIMYCRQRGREGEGTCSSPYKKIKKKKKKKTVADKLKTCWNPLFHPLQASRACANCGWICIDTTPSMIFLTAKKITDAREHSTSGASTKSWAQREHCKDDRRSAGFAVRLKWLEWLQCCKQKGPFHNSFPWNLCTVAEIPWFSLPAVTYILLLASAYASHSTPAAKTGCAGSALRSLLSASWPKTQPAILPLISYKRPNSDVGTYSRCHVHNFFVTDTSDSPHKKEAKKADTSHRHL